MCVAWAKLYPRQHTYFAFEAVPRRAQKSLSDMAGTDFNIHDGRPEGVMRELCNAFVRQSRKPTVPDMMHAYRSVQSLIPAIMKRTGARSLFEARAFEDLIALAAYTRGRML